jgi:glycosyltransferase involved in cell wall biosynthesis
VTPVASVVIPAHDERAHIAEHLTALLADLPEGTLEVVVVCNGCTDDTATVAGGVPGVRVVELPEASKIAALRAGDAEAAHFPRIYLDADVRLAGAAAAALAHALTTPAPRVAGVLPEVDLSGASWAVRRFYGFRLRLPVLQQGIIGAGVYALNEAARDRIGDWPDVLGDDGYVFRSFSPRERILVAGHRTRVVAPPTLGVVIRRGVRVRRGNAELGTLAAGRVEAAPSTGVLTALRQVGREPSRWPDAAVWLAASVVIRLLTRLRWAGDWQQGRGRPSRGAPASPSDERR